MKYCYFKTRNRRGFTLVELMVVLAVTAILAVLAGGGLLAYTRLARFQKNESNARAMFQTAQLAAAQMELAGEKDDFTALVAAEGNGGHITEPLTDTMTQEECDALNARVCALYFDKGAEPTPDTPEGKLYAYIKDYVYDSSFLDAAFCIEIDASTGQVFSVFYDSGTQALRFADNKGQTDATLLDDRSYQNRRDQTLVGYYCADDAVNVVNLQQSKLRVRNQRLINGETLDLTWGGTSKSNETDTQYTVDICSKTTKKKLFSVLVTLPTVTETQKELPVTLYNEDGSEKSTDNYFFPLRYANGSFVLTLDAMNDAAILQAHSEDASIDKTEFFSITRFVKDATDIYATITAAPRAESVTSYTVSEGADTNTENSLYAKGGATAELQCFRHLYNLRWYAKNADLTAKLTKDIDWLSGAPVVYCAEGKSAAAKTPAADAPVAWPSLLELKEKVTLDGNNKTITGLQMRGNSVAKDGCRYIGLVAENSGTIKNLTLADPDVLVNLTAGNGTGTTYTVGGEALALMDTKAEDYRKNVRAVGALCGVSTGTVQNCTVKRSKNRTATARVAASLTFNDTTTTYTRVKNADGKTIENEPLGIGGLVGSAVPGKNQTLEKLTVDKNVTVAGIWQDGGTKTTTAATPNEATERNRLTTDSIDRAIGVGGVFGVLSLQEPCTVDTLNNSAEVCGNAYTGGVAGNLCGKSITDTTLTNLNNTGSVNALAGYQGYTAGASRVLGQFFGGVAGRMKNAALTNSYSSTRSSLSENDVKTLIVNGYNDNGTLSAASPLQGDFVGGLVGFGEDVKISHCQTGSGYVLGNTFVGGVVGGLSTGTVLSDGTANSSHVFGHRYVGGVVSFNGSGSTITGMSNTGMTAAFGKEAAYAGGIVGYNEGTLSDCTAAASTNTATNTSRVQLLQAMAQNHYADFVGGVAGYNAGTITWMQDAAVSTLLHGGSFVGGVVGFNDAGAAITVADSATLTVSGRIAGVQDAVGGLVGLNCGTALPAVTVKAELVSGRYCVGGVLGANVVATSMTATGLCTDGSGNSLQAQALAGGIVGYNQVIQTMPTADNTITRAKRLLPTVTDTDSILTVAGQTGDTTATVTLNDCTNALNLTADAYVGGVVGYGEHLALNNAVNGAQHSVSKGVLHSSGSLSAQPASSAVTGNAAGGIIGYAGGSATLQNCQNYAGVFHKQMAGGIAGYNAGIIKDCTQSANLGTRQAGYTYIGGIAGVNAGTIQASAPDRVTISGEQAVGGVAGLNAQNGKIQGITDCTVTVQGNQVVGGLAGKNNGTVQGSNLQNVNVATSGSNAGGAVGQNSGTVQSVTVTGGSVQGSDAVGGLAGENLGRVESCKTEAALTVRANQNAGAAVGSNAENAVVSAGSYAGTVYAASGNAGGIAGQNAGSIADNATVSATVTCENGDAGGVAALNGGSISAVQVNGCTVNSGSAYMGAVAAVNNGTIQGVTVQSAALQGDATVIGGIAGLNNATIGTETSACKVEQNALTLSGLTAADITLGGAAGQNEKDAIINNVQVALNVTQNLAKYRILGGVAGANNGTLQSCTFTAGQLGETITSAAPAKAGAAEVRDAIGGVAGVNNEDAKVENCTVRNIRINVLGITNVESSQDVATKLVNASHVGGIVGRNKGTIQSSFIGTDESSAVIAKFGFVGGIAGSNAGEIKGCGGQGTADAVKQIKDWLEAGETDEMITQLKYSQDVDNASETNSANDEFNALRGVDAVRAGNYTTVYTTGLTKNQLTVALRGSATISTEEAAGYLGGVTGYNTDTGVISETATGKWFVYCDNGNVDNAVIGGMIGQNESDKDMTNLLNCAAVRRFNRTENGTDGNDDTQNSSNQRVANANVGGVIGVQQNRSGDRWSLTNVVNYGTVHNSRSNNLAGIICLWVDNGGTLEHCFNFGTMRANSNGGGGSGTMGGIVALFDKPVAGGTTNLVSCQNHGDMLWENEGKKKTANDVGGILGKIQMKNASDYLVVNITDCVNGSIKMQSNSLCVGIMAWLGPEGAIPNAEVNIDRCRNYCVDTTSVGGAGAAVGIYGNRGNGGSYRAATTITNCFVLNASNNSDNAIMRPYGGSREENIHLDPNQPNLYMDKNSFAVSTASDTKATPYALETLKRGEVYKNGESYNEPKSGKDRSNKTYDFTTPITPGYRIYAGKNTTDNTYFAALITGMGAGGGKTLEKINGGNSYIQDNTIVSNADTSNKLADILFTFGESGTADADKKYDSNRPDMSDITDTAVQAYYKDVLDEKFSMETAKVTNIQAVLSDATGDGAPIYGRYRVTWKAVTGASRYKVTVKVDINEDGNYTAMPEMPTATVYTNQYTFEAPKDWAGKKYIVEVTPCNSKEGKAPSSSKVFTFAKTLPTPQLQLLTYENGIDLMLGNVGDYTGVDVPWVLTVTCVYDNGTTKEITKNSTEIGVKTLEDGSKRQVKGYLCWFPDIKNQTVIMRATVKANNSAAWMQSAQYNVRTYDSGDNYGGLGTLTIANVAVTGTSTDNLAITADVKITNQTVNPKYRIMLQGKPKDKNLTSVKGHTIGDAYVTLQAVEMVLSGSATHVTFSDLPDAALTEFTDLRILAAPVNTGMGDTTCRWEFRPGEDDYNHPVEYVRVEEGKMVRYEDYCFASLWHPENYPCTKTAEVNLTVLPAPTLSADATPTLVDNNLLYTFTWDNAAGAENYTYKLYGVTDANNEVEINLPAGAATMTTEGTQPTLTVAVDKLTHGAADWHFATVRLAVTSVPKTGSTNTVGATASREYTGIRTRLTQPGAPNSILLTNNADAETLPYEITWTGIADGALGHYQLQAGYEDENGNWKTTGEWTGNKDASLIVNLEKYQGKTLRLRVVAVPADESGAVLRSPYSVTSNEFTVVTRETAPTVTEVKFTNTTPTQDEFLNRLQVQFTVNDSASHYVTGYLFKDKNDYDAVVNLVNAWNTATDEKAAALKALQEKLETLLQDGNKAVCLIPQESRTTGVQAETTGNTVQYTLTPDKFAMQPQYGGWYLLPAVRTMTTAENKACSVWTYYTTALKVPCIRLEPPLAVRSTSAYTGAAIISDTPDAETGTEATLTVQRIAVQWSADNLYTADGGETMLADTYEVKVTPTTGNGDAYTLRITVQPKDEYEKNEDGNTKLDENGNPVVTIARGAVLKVEKIVDESTSFELKPNDDDGSWYLDTIQTTDKDGNTVLQSQPTTLTGTILQEGNLLRYYTMQVRPMLQYDAAAKTYHLILPDLAQAVYADPSDTTGSGLTAYTATVQITAKGANVQPSQPATINPQQTN